MTKFDKKLDKLMAVKRDKTFLIKLAGWLVDISGNVNAAMRLKVIAERTKGSQGEGL